MAAWGPAERGVDGDGLEHNRARTLTDGTSSVMAQVPAQPRHCAAHRCCAFASANTHLTSTPSITSPREMPKPPPAGVPSKDTS